MKMSEKLKTILDKIFLSLTKITQDSRKIHILRLKTVVASEAPSGSQTPGLQTNVSAN